MDIPTQSGKNVPRSPSAPLASRHVNDRHILRAAAPTPARPKPSPGRVPGASSPSLETARARDDASVTDRETPFARAASSPRISYSPADVMSTGDASPRRAVDDVLYRASTASRVDGARSRPRETNALALETNETRRGAARDGEWREREFISRGWEN